MAELSLHTDSAQSRQEQYLRQQGRGKRREPKPSLRAALWQAAGTQQEQWYKAMQVWGVGGGLFLKKAPEICIRWRFHLKKLVAQSYQEKLCQEQKKKPPFYKIAYLASTGGQAHYGGKQRRKALKQFFLSPAKKYTPKWKL